LSWILGVRRCFGFWGSDSDHSAPNSVLEPLKPFIESSQLNHALLAQGIDFGKRHMGLGKFSTSARVRSGFWRAAGFTWGNCDKANTI
jgi:hypothetical protein